MNFSLIFLNSKFLEYVLFHIYFEICIILIKLTIEMQKNHDRKKQRADEDVHFLDSSRSR